MIIYLGNKNYSSWSLRAWLALKATGLEFEEVVIPLDGPGTAAAIGARSPSGRVPALHHDGLVIWDSLAIGEYLAEVAPDAGLLPKDRGQRAVARAVISEMHSSFAALRTHMPMNIRAHYPNRGVPEAVAADIGRITVLWQSLRTETAAGPFLFGEPSLADLFFAPVVSRFRTYAVSLDAAAQAYADSVWALPAMQEWIAAARAEPIVVAKYEV